MSIREIESLTGMEQENVQCNEYKGDTLPQVFYPWRRYFARTLDIFLYNTFWSAILGLIFHVNLTTRSNFGRLIDLIIVTAIMLFLEPILLHLFGTTLGKMIFGLRIESSDGKRLSYGEGFERTWGIIGAGFGYNIPIYNLIRLWRSYNLCKENEIQPWDEYIAYTIKDTKAYRSVVFVGTYAVLFFLLSVTISAQQLPPNRGDLTVAEFAENFNYYAKFYGIDFADKYFDENGNWAEKPFDGTVYVNFGVPEQPEYIYTTEDGYLTGISFTVEQENSDEWLYSYDTQMLLASFAFTGAQDEIGLFSKVPKRILNQIQNNTFNDFRFTEANVEFIYDVEYSGYTDTHAGFLVPDENAKETYFKIEFSMKKQK